MSTAQEGRTHGCSDQRRKWRFSLPTRSRPHMAHRFRWRGVAACRFTGADPKFAAGAL